MQCVPTYKYADGNYLYQWATTRLLPHHQQLQALLLLTSSSSSLRRARPSALRQVCTGGRALRSVLFSEFTLMLAAASRTRAASAPPSAQNLAINARAGAAGKSGVITHHSVLGH